jgi:hypothetical protein
MFDGPVDRLDEIVQILDLAGRSRRPTVGIDVLDGGPICTALVDGDGIGGPC